MLFKFLLWLSRYHWLPPFVSTIGGDNEGYVSFYLDLPFGSYLISSEHLTWDLAVLDQSDNRVYLYRDFDLAFSCESEDVEEFLIKHNHNPSSCDWMASPIIEMKNNVK